MSKVTVATGSCVCLMPPLAITLAIVYTVGAPKGPRCYIHELYVPALDLSLEGELTTSNSTNSGRIVNPSLFFDLAIRNGMKNYYARYDNINLTFSYDGNNIARYVIWDFFQLPKDTAYRRDLVETSEVPWVDLLKEVYNGSNVNFRVDMAARVRFYSRDSKSGSYNKRKTKRLRIGADVEVDGSGMKIHQGFVRLNSTAPNSGVGVLFLVCLLNLI